MKKTLDTKTLNTLIKLLENNPYCDAYDTFDISGKCYCEDDAITDIIDNINNANRNISYISFKDITEEKQTEILEDIAENIHLNNHYYIVNSIDNIEVSTNIYKWLLDIENATIEIYNWEYKYFIELLEELKTDAYDSTDEDIKILNKLIDEINEYYQNI